MRILLEFFDPDGAQLGETIIYLTGTVPKNSAMIPGRAAWVRGSFLADDDDPPPGPTILEGDRR